MKPNILLFVILLTTLIIIGGIFINFAKEEKQGNPPEQSLIAPNTHEYFWSETCPHCANVADFMEGWEGKDKIQMDKFEVSKSAENAQKFVARGSYCRIPQNQLGVPLLVTPSGECFIGDTPVIDYFKSLEL